MTNTTIITALPIGEIDTDVMRSEFESIIGAFKDMGIDLFVADPVSDVESARQSVQELSKKRAGSPTPHPLTWTERTDNRDSRLDESVALLDLSGPGKIRASQQHAGCWGITGIKSSR